MLGLTQLHELVDTLGPDALRCECPECRIHSMVLVGTPTPLVCRNCGAVGLAPIGVIPTYRAATLG
jgi:ribosomal protein S27E